MTFADYLCAKYGTLTPTTMTRAEAICVGLKYPLQNGWIHIARSIVIDSALDAKLKLTLEKLSERKNKVANKAKKSSQRKAATRTLKFAHIGQQKLKDAHITLTTPIDPTSNGFLESKAWKRLRYMALQKYGAQCMCCGATPASGSVMNVDHIRPRRLFPQLALDLNNLQVLCGLCNEAKGNWDMTDWRARVTA